MRNECSEKILLEKLKEALQKESSVDGETLDSVLQWWMKTCGILLTESSVELEEEYESISIAEIEENEKLPSRFIRRFEELEKQHGIRSLRLSLRHNGYFGKRVSILVTGEAEAELREKDNLIFVMVYNHNQEMIGYGEDVLRCKYEGEVVTFDFSIHLPDDEFISKVEVRIAPRSSLL